MQTLNPYYMIIENPNETVREDSFAVLRNSLPVLLSQLKTIAGYIKFYDIKLQHKGYFDSFVQDLEHYNNLYHANNAICDGNMEASQAVLLAFTHQLNRIIQTFNHRWTQVPEWYINEILKIKDREAVPDKAWLRFTKNSPNKIHLEKNTEFTYDKAPSEEKIIYRLLEDTEISNMEVAEVYAVYFEKHPDIYPANALNNVTGIRKTDLLNPSDTNVSNVQSLGLQISTPALLLREGKRKVDISFVTEKGKSSNIAFNRNILSLARLTADATTLFEKVTLTNKEDIRRKYGRKILENLFYIEVSTADGWKDIEKYTIEEDKKDFKLSFLLPENFPATVACSLDIHGTITKFPALKIQLNHNAYLYPYDWLKSFVIEKIVIDTHVKNINNLQIYNELGRIDYTIPFPLFGINTEQGAWFAVGNYEMALKNTTLIDLRIRWQQLPQDENGLTDYYKAYKSQINNCSFRLQPRYLNNYTWKNIPTLYLPYLFNTKIKGILEDTFPTGQLDNETLLSNGSPNEMQAIRIDEDDYEYTTQSREGFISFVLAEPKMGFGEKKYRELFVDNIIKKIKKKKSEEVLNTPLNPMVEQMSLSYLSTDEIDLRTRKFDENISIQHLYPFGAMQVFPVKENKPIPFIYSLNAEMNLFFALKNAEDNETIRLFIDFCPQTTEISLQTIPEIKWYWGDGYHWQEFPETSIIEDSTQNMLVSGQIKILLPKISEENTDENGRLWLRAAILKRSKMIPTIKNIFTNSALVSKDCACVNFQKTGDYIINTSVKTLPGISGIQQISDFFSGDEQENTISKLKRIANYSTHHGRAVVPRDYERMVLRMFPEVAKVKCLVNVFGKNDENINRNTVSLIVIPQQQSTAQLPLSTSDLLLKIEQFFEHNVSAFVNEVDAVNPVYEQIVVKCAVVLAPGVASVRLTRTINRIIADWFVKKTLPEFDQSFSLKVIYNAIKNNDQIKRLKHISVQHLQQKGDRFYLLKEYTDVENDRIQPSSPYAILFPGKHIITTDTDFSFGVNDMLIEETFVIN